MIPESVGGSCDEEPRRSATRRHDNPHIAEAKQPRQSQCGSSASARFSLRGLRKRPGRKTGLHPRRRFVRAAPAPRPLLCGQGVARTVKGQWAKREARHGRRRGALFIWTRETRPRNARGGRGPRRGGWHLTRGEGLERRAWERIREAPTVRVVSEPWNGWTSRSLGTGPRSCTPQATVTRGPAQRCVEGAASGPAAIGVETAVSVDATLSLHLGRTVSGCHVFIVTSS